MAAEHAGGDHERGGGGDVGGGHRGAFVPAGDPEAPGGRAGESDLEDVAPRGQFGVAVGVAGEARVGSAAGGDERDAEAEVGVGGEAPVFGGGAHRDHVGRARGVRGGGVRLVAGGRHHDDPVAVGVAQRGDQLGDVRRGDAPGEFEGQVDDPRAVVDREAHPPGDRGGVAVAFGVEHSHGHHAHPVGEAGEAPAVVGGLRDGARDERAVAVAVEGVRGVGDEVVALHELVAVEVGRAAERPAVGVRDAGVEHRHDHPPPPGGVVGDQVRPCAGRFDPEGPHEVPLQFPPPPGDAGEPGVVGERFAASGCSGGSRRGRCGGEGRG